jgi:hypothetical protein
MNMNESEIFVKLYNMCCGEHDLNIIMKNINYVIDAIKKYSDSPGYYDTIIYIKEKREFRYLSSFTNYEHFFINEDIFNIIKMCEINLSNEEQIIRNKFIKVYYYIANKKKLLYNKELYDEIIYIGKLICEYENNEKNKFGELDEDEKKITKLFIDNYLGMETVIAIKNIYFSSLQYSLHNNYKPGSVGYTLAKEEFETLAKEQKETNINKDKLDQQNIN